jgi:hypothetical protein
VFVLACFADASGLRAQIPALGPEFQVNTYTTSHQSYPSVATSLSGCFIVTWDSLGQGAAGQSGIFEHAYDEFSASLTGEIAVNTFTTGSQRFPAVAASPDTDCDSVIVWQSDQDGSIDGIFARRFRDDGIPVGGEFPVNAFTLNAQESPAAGMDVSGRFVIVWMSFSEDGSGFGIVGRRFDADGTPLSGDFVVNTTTTGDQMHPSVSMEPSGEFVVAWQSLSQDGDQEGVFARRYDASGNALSSEIPINVHTTGRQILPSVAVDTSGGFVVAWQSEAQDGAGWGVFARRFDSAGDPATGELAVNTYTPGDQKQPRAGILPDGGFLVAWDGAGAESGSGGLQTWARRFAADSTARDDAFRVNVYTSSNNQSRPTLSCDPRGGFVIAWQSLSQDGDGFGIFVRPGGFPDGRPLAVDEVAADSGSSDVNGVLETGETVVVDAAWHNGSLVNLPLTGQALGFDGPAGPVYTIVDDTAAYGTIAAGASKECFAATENCFEVQVTGARPAAHWDTTLSEDLSSGASKAWTLHVGESFADVEKSNLFYRFVETILHGRITAGGFCGGYCPTDSTLRKQMAVFVLKAKEGPFFVPPPATGLFNDVPAADPFAPWIEELFRRGVVAGCATPGGPNYCPDEPVLRQQMAVFLLRTLEGSAYVPPECTGVFDDVTCPGLFTDFIEELAARQIAAGCGGNNYCPGDVTTRGQMAPFLVKTFGLQLYGP